MQEAGVKAAPEVWLVFGWKVGQAALKKAITEMPPEEMSNVDGLRVIVSTDGQYALLGKVLATGTFSNGAADLGWFLVEDEAERLARKIEKLGFGELVLGKPSYWFAGGR